MSNYPDHPLKDIIIKDFDEHLEEIQAILRDHRENNPELIAYSEVIRPPVPIASGHLYRFDPAGDSGASGPPHFDTV